MKRLAIAAVGLALVVGAFGHGSLIRTDRTGIAVASSDPAVSAAASCCGAAEYGSEEALSTENSSIPPGSIIITELMVDPQEVADQAGEYVELYNPAGATYDLQGLVLKDDGMDYHVISSSLLVAPGDYLVLCKNGDPSLNGGFTCDYQYSSFTLGNAGDEVILMEDDTLIDQVWYNGPIVPNGASLNLDPNAFDAVSNDNLSNWCEATSAFGDGDLGTPGTYNDECDGGPSTDTPTPTNTPTATNTPTPTAASPVGGIAELPDVAGERLERDGSSGANAGVLAGVAAAVAASVIALGGVAWYARRRWIS